MASVFLRIIIWLSEFIMPEKGMIFPVALVFPYERQIAGAYLRLLPAFSYPALSRVSPVLLLPDSIMEAGCW
jgi:hypothetical protein